jgi:hypothetical protein
MVEEAVMGPFHQQQQERDTDTLGQQKFLLLFISRSKLKFSIFPDQKVISMLLLNSLNNCLSCGIVPESVYC